LLLAITIAFYCFSLDDCAYIFIFTSFLPLLNPVEVEFCIEEWSTGHYLKKSSFEEADNLARYTSHHQKLIEWRSLNPSVVDKMLKKRYDRMRYVLFLFAYTVLTVTQEEFWGSDNQGYIHQDD
jgi:hypothetical protein